MLGFFDIPVPRFLIRFFPFCSIGSDDLAELPDIDRDAVQFLCRSGVTCEEFNTALSEISQMGLTCKGFAEGLEVSRIDD